MAEDAGKPIKARVLKRLVDGSVIGVPAEEMGIDRWTCPGDCDRLTVIIIHAQDEGLTVIAN